MILCLDDEPNVLITRKLVLESAGYEVLGATGTREGLELFLSRPVRAVVIDYLMPDMTGDVVAREMKRVKPEVPIVMISAYFELPDVTLTSVDAFVPKGDGPVALLNALGRLLNPGPVERGVA